MDLYRTHARDLDTFIYKYLQPDDRFLSQVAETIDKICTFLKGQSPYKISKAVKGGSLGKGTAVKNGSDADMVLFLNYFKSFEDQKKNRAEILSSIRVLLLKYEKQIGHQIKMSQPSIIPASSSPRTLNFQFKSTESSDFVEVNVLLAFDALGQLTSTRVNNPVYEALIATGERGREFSTCFTELQRNFVKARPTKLKGLIRLVKYWYTEYVCGPCKPKLGPGEYLPLKYALELLIIYAWESAGKGENFSTAEGFRTILKLIVQYKDLLIFWTTNYNFDSDSIGRFLKNKLKETKPMILDPADPTDNVAAAARWDLVAEVAEYCLQQNCVQDVNSWDVKPVKSVLVSVDCMPHPLDVKPPYPIKRIKQEVGNHIGRSNCYLEGNGKMLQQTSTLSDYGIFRNKRIMDLYQTHPCDLDTYIYIYLQPDERFLSQVAETIDKICTFLKGQCPYKISKTVKGGSLGKGTAVKNGSDADMVLFLNYFKSFEDQKKNRAEILSNIRVLLLKYEKQIGHQIKMSQPRIIPASSSPRSINLQFKSTESSDFVEVDVLPAFDALGPLTWTRVNNPVYEALIDTGERGGEFSTCFTELQRNFVKARPTKLKGLIRLVKYWYTEYVRRPYKCQLGPGEYLPPKYALELLIIYAWESAEKGEKFKTAEGFRTVLELIVQYEDLWIFWTTNYNFDSYNIGRFLKNKLKEPKPMILDPADPTGNVAAAARWDLVAEVAEYCLQQNCVQDVNSWDVKPVKSVLVSVDCMPHPLDVNPFYQVRHIIWVAQKHTGKSNCYLEWNGSMLQDTATLSDYGIFHNVTFLLKEDPSWCTLL